MKTADFQFLELEVSQNSLMGGMTGTPFIWEGKGMVFPVDLIFPKINSEKRTIFLRLQQSSRVLIPFAFAAKYPRIFFQDEF